MSVRQHDVRWLLTLTLGSMIAIAFVWQYINAPDPPPAIVALVPLVSIALLSFRVVMRMDWLVALAYSLNIILLLPLLFTVTLVLVGPVPGGRGPIWRLWEILLPPLLAGTLCIANLQLIRRVGHLSPRIRATVYLFNLAVAISSLVYFLDLSRGNVFDRYLSLVAAATFSFSAFAVSRFSRIAP